MQKSAILIKKIKNVQINNSKNFVKILGIYFTNDLQKASTYKWELYQSHLEKQLQQLCRRQISRRGKATLSNTLILSKVTFLISIFPIPTKIQQQIYIKNF